LNFGSLLKAEATTYNIIFTGIRPLAAEAFGREAGFTNTSDFIGRPEYRNVSMNWGRDIQLRSH